MSYIAKLYNKCNVKEEQKDERMTTLLVWCELFSTSRSLKDLDFFNIPLLFQVLQEVKKIKNSDWTAFLNF